MKIYVNSTIMEWNQNTISYEQILELAKKKPGVTVMMSYPKQDKKSRTVIAGELADAYDGMVICAVRTDNA